jgi:hypothetical protein
MTLVISKGLTLDNGTRAAAIAGVSPTLDYRFAREKREIETVSLTDKLTFTGGNQGTFTGSDGFIQRATTNVPRFDHDPLSRQSLGLLSEGSGENLLLQSGWAGATTGTPGNAPTNWTVGFGSNTVTTVVPSSAGPIANAVKFDYDISERVMFQQAINVVSGVQYAFSIYIESLDGAAAGNVLLAVSGTATLTQNAGVSNPTTPGRYTYLFTPNSTGTVNVRAGAGTSVGVAGTGSITLSRPQVEAATTPSTYIPTTSAAVTRTADSAVIDGTGVITGTYTLVEKPAGCAVVSGTNINLQSGFTAERIMVFPAALDAGQITAIRGAM